MKPNKTLLMGLMAIASMSFALPQASQANNASMVVTHAPQPYVAKHQKSFQIGIAAQPAPGSNAVPKVKAPAKTPASNVYIHR